MKLDSSTSFASASGIGFEIFEDAQLAFEVKTLSKKIADADLDHPDVDYTELFKQPVTKMLSLPSHIYQEVRELTDPVISLRRRHAAFTKLRALGYELESVSLLDHATHSLVPLSSQLGKPLLINVNARLYER